MSSRDMILALILCAIMDLIVAGCLVGVLFVASLALTGCGTYQGRGAYHETPLRFCLRGELINGHCEAGPQDP